MSQITELLVLTEFTAELFSNTNDKFPELVTIVTLTEVDEIVKDTIKRMLSFFAEYPEAVIVDFAFAKKIVHPDESEDILTPNMLVLLLNYGDDQRMILLELAASQEHFSVH